MLCGCFFSFYSSNSIKHLSGEPKVENLEDHCYAASPTLADHQYASHGPLWLKECDALQHELVGKIPRQVTVKSLLSTQVLSCYTLLYF